MPTPLYYPSTVNGLQKTLDASLLTGVTASATLNNVTGIQNLKGVMVIDRVDGNNNLTPNKREYIGFAGTSGSTVVTLTRGLAGSTDQDHAVGAIVEFVSDVTQQQAIIDGLLQTVNTNGTLDTTKVVDLTTAQTLTNKVLGPTNFSAFNAPQGFLINGKIVPSVASNNLTVAIKGLDGNDPSATNPVYCRIGDTVRSITSALSVTANAGVSLCNAGSAELATKEIDWFVYLGWNVAQNNIVLAFSRIPYAQRLDDFAYTNETLEKSAKFSTGISGYTVSDPYELIGRFAATLSAGAGYTWSVPTFTTANLIQRPIYETRWLTWLPTYTAGGSMTFGTVTTGRANYKIQGDKLTVSLYANGTLGGSASNTVIATAPFTSSAAVNSQWQGGACQDSGDSAGPICATVQIANPANLISFRRYDSSNFDLGAAFIMGNPILSI